MRNVVLLAPLFAFVGGCAHQRPVAAVTIPAPTAITYAQPAPAPEPPPQPEPAPNPPATSPLVTAQTLTPADSSVVDELKNGLKRNGLPTPDADVHIYAQDGTVFLKGSVPTKDEKQMIDAIARETSGLANFNDELTVEPPELASTTSPLYFTAPDVPTNAPPPTPPAVTQPLPLTPTGRAESRVYPATPDTTQAAQPPMQYGDAPGGVTVNVVGATPADQPICRDLVHELRRDRALAIILPSIHIRVEQGLIRLQGSVRNEHEHSLIKSAVVKVRGGQSIDDEITVQDRDQDANQAPQNEQAVPTQAPPTGQGANPPDVQNVPTPVPAAPNPAPGAQPAPQRLPVPPPAPPAQPR